MYKKRNRQTKNDQRAVLDEGAVGADDLGGKDTPSKLSRRNDEPKFKGIRFHRDED